MRGHGDEHEHQPRAELDQGYFLPVAAVAGEEVHPHHGAYQEDAPQADQRRQGIHWFAKSKAIGKTSTRRLRERLPRSTTLSRRRPLASWPNRPEEVLTTTPGRRPGT